MKKFFFVAVIAAAMVSCTETTVKVSPEDSARTADSIAKANAPKMDTTTTPKMDTMTVTPKMDTVIKK